VSIQSTGLSDCEVGQTGTAGGENDLVWGAEAIGAVINRTPKQVFYLHQRKLIPTKSVGRQLVGSKSRLRACLTD
jgi:hypothetical protein